MRDVAHDDRDQALAGICFLVEQHSDVPLCVALGYPCVACWDELTPRERVELAQRYGWSYSYIEARAQGLTGGTAPPF